MNGDAPPTTDSQDNPAAAETDQPRSGGAAWIGVTPIAVVVGVASGWMAWQSPPSVKVILLLLAAWHGVRRLVALAGYVTKDEESSSLGATILEWTVCVLWFGAAILFSAHRMDVLLFTAYGAGMPLIPAMWMQGLQLLWGLSMAAVTAVFLIHYLWQRMQGYGEGALGLLLLATSIGVWWYAMMGIEDILLGLLLFEVFQLVQGLTVVWRLASSGQRADTGMAALYRCSVCWVIAYLVVFSAYGIVYSLGRVPPEGVVITDATVRFIAALAAATLTIHYLLDEALMWRLNHRVTSPKGKPAARGLMPRFGSAVVWGGAFVTAGWLAASERNANDLSLQVYDNVVTAYPGSWRAHTGLAVELIKIGELPSALEELTLAAELNPDAAEVRIELGRMLHALNQTDKAVAEFRRAIELNPAASMAYTELGKTLFSQGQVQEGLAYLQDALKRRPKDPVAYIDIALAQASLREWESALSSFDAAIALDPEFAIAYNGRGNVLWSKGDLDAALGEYNEAIRIAPKVAKPYRNRAGVWLDKGEIEKAVNDLASAIEVDGSNAEDFVRRGDLFYSQEKFDLALKDYEAAAQLEQRFTTPIERLVTLWTSCPNEELRNLESAVAAARTACQMTEWRSPGALQMLAGVLAAQGKYDEALRWQSQAVDLASSETKEAFQKQLEVFKRLSQGSDTDDPNPGSQRGS